MTEDLYGERASNAPGLIISHATNSARCDVNIPRRELDRSYRSSDRWPDICPDGHIEAEPISEEK